MARFKRKGIPVQPVDQTAEFAGYQYQATPAPQVHSKHYRFFKDTITKLLYCNFKWYGLTPAESQMLEYLLINEGRAVAVKSEFDLSILSPEGVYIGRPGTDVPDLKYDFYGHPTQCSCSGFSDLIVRAYDPQHFAMCFDTSANIRNQTVVAPLSTYIDELATDLDNAYSAWRVACETRKSGMVFNVPDPKSAKMLEGVLTRLGDNNPWIVITGNQTAFDAMTVPQFAPNNTQAIGDYHNNFLNAWNSVLDLLGLENAQQDKRERLVVAEALSNKNISRYVGADRLKARKEFAREFSEKFGVEIRVENYLASVATETMNQANIQGDNPGKDGYTNGGTPESD